MKTQLHHLTLATTAAIEIQDMTEAVRELVTSTGIRDGIVTLHSPHTTAYVSLNESEEALRADMVDYLHRVVPRAGDYRHNIAPVDDRDNAHAHLMGLFLNASETLPLVDGRLCLGSWQAVLFIEVDGPRPRRELQLHIMGTG